jgi:hypothetical protein
VNGGYQIIYQKFVRKQILVLKIEILGFIINFPVARCIDSPITNDLQEVNKYCLLKFAQ